AILSLIACEDYELEQLNVNTAFLHGNLKETIYMRQPPGFEEGTSNKSVSVPLGAHFKVSLKDCPSSDWDVERMSKVLYANVVGSLMYLMVCTRPYIAYVVSIVSGDQRKHVDVDSFVDADYAKDPNKGLDDEALVEFMVEWCEEDEDDDRNEEDGLFN
nr:retrovirus-related Pol polyprotein from transposon TNT 1-94 [Tanacetum cinerariifolium]